MIRIIVAEDDYALNRLVCDYLEKNGYQAIPCKNGLEALEAFYTQEPSMIISDIMMPELDGYQLAERIRSKDTQIPILFMTAIDSKTSKKYGYQIGVDDYVDKPFDAEILMLRVGALLRRASISKSKELVAGNLTMNEEEHTAYVDGEELPLTVREFDLLYKLLSFPRRAFSRSALMEEFWDYDSSATSRTVDVYMAKIREKTSSCNGFEIVTVHGLGYKAVLK